MGLLQANHICLQAFDGAEHRRPLYRVAEAPHIPGHHTNIISHSQNVAIHGASGNPAREAKEGTQKG